MAFDVGGNYSRSSRGISSIWKNVNTWLSYFDFKQRTSFLRYQINTNQILKNNVLTQVLNVLPFMFLEKKEQKQK